MSREEIWSFVKSEINEYQNGTRIYQGYVLMNLPKEISNLSETIRFVDELMTDLVDVGVLKYTDTPEETSYWKIEDIPSLRTLEEVQQHAEALRVLKKYTHNLPSQLFCSVESLFCRGCTLKCPGREQGCYGRRVHTGLILKEFSEIYKF